MNSSFVNGSFSTTNFSHCNIPILQGCVCRKQFGLPCWNSVVLRQDGIEKTLALRQESCFPGIKASCFFSLSLRQDFKHLP